METYEQQALRMACNTFLSEYIGTPKLDTLDLLIATGTVWEPFEDYDPHTIQDFIIKQYRANLCELEKRI